MARDRKLNLKLNKPGSAGFSYPMNADHAELIDKYKIGIIAERFNWRQTRVNNLANIPGDIWDPIWSGYILTIDEDWSNNKMQLGCVGWLQRLTKRLVRTNLTWTGIDDGVIIGDILQSVNGSPAGPSYEFASGTTSYVATDSYTVRWPTGSTPNTSTWIKWGGVQPNEGVGGATAYVAQTRNFKVTRYQDANTPIDQLINIENGCDVVCDPLTRVVTVHRKYRRMRDDVVFGFQWGPENIAQFGRTIDGDRQCNYFLAEGDAASVAGYAEDTASIAQVGPIEEVAQLSGVTGAGAGGTANPVLLAYAGAEVLVRKDGVITYGLQPFVYSPSGSVPEPLLDYRPGDQVRATAIHPPRGNIVNQAVRVFGMDFSIDDNDNPILGALDLAP